MGYFLFHSQHTNGQAMGGETLEGRKKVALDSLKHKCIKTIILFSFKSKQQHFVSN